MSGGEELLDLRGEVCALPELRIEKRLRESPDRRPFVVLVDHRPTLESIQALAARHGWRCEAAEVRGGFRARFTHPAGE